MQLTYSTAGVSRCVSIVSTDPEHSCSVASIEYWVSTGPGDEDQPGYVSDREYSHIEGGFEG